MNEHDIMFSFDSIQHETDNGIALKIHGVILWFPRSKVDVHEKRKVVYIPKWLAEAKNLI